MGHLGTLGTNVVQASSTTGAVTAGFGVAVGGFIVFTVVWSADLAAIPTVSSVSDGRSNTYTADVSAGTSNSTVQCAIITAPVTTALQASDTITVTISPARIRWAMQADAFGSVGAVDKTAQNHNPGSGTSMATGTTATTAYASELLIGCWGFGRGGGATSTLDAGWSGGAMVTTAAGSTDRALQMGYQYVSATGAQSGTCSLDIAATHVGAIATYTHLAAPPPPNPVVARRPLLVR